MSHFTVLVIGPDVDKQLAPYHEFECTGTDDEFVQDIDQTSEFYAEFAEGNCSRYRDAAGILHDPYGDEFYREMTADEVAKIGRVAGTGCGHGVTWTSKDWNDGRGYRAKVHFLPEGWEEVTVPRKQVEAFETWLEDYHGKKIVVFGQEPDLSGEHKYGYAQLGADGKVAKIVDRTNPNKKWDWYQVGGRWTGKLLLKDRALGTVGRAGLMTDPAAPGYADQAKKGDIDLEQMRNDAGAKAHAFWRSTREITGGQSWETWEDTRTRYPDIARAREEYNSQPAIEMLKASGNKAYQWDLDDDLSLDEGVFVARKRAAACTFFAYLKDGQWEERGRMGWFASVSDEVSEAQWHERFNRMIDVLPENTLLTVVDCHI